MNNTKNPTALQSQKWIVQALLDLMQNTNYDKISVSEICRKAQLDRRTFYRNFNSKNEVLKQYVKSLSNEYMTKFNDINSKDKQEATLLFFTFWQQYLPFIVNVQNCGLGSFVFMQFEKFVKSKQELLIDNNIVNTQIDYLFAYRIGGFWNAMVTWATNGENISSEELSAIIYNA